MKFVTFHHNNHSHAGVVSNDQVISLAGIGIHSVLELITAGQEALLRVKSLEIGRAHV